MQLASQEPMKRPVNRCLENFNVCKQINLLWRRNSLESSDVNYGIYTKSLISKRSPSKHFRVLWKINFLFRIVMIYKLIMGNNSVLKPATRQFKQIVKLRGKKRGEEDRWRGRLGSKTKVAITSRGPLS